MSRDVRLYLEDIQLSCQKIIRYTSGMSFDAFLKDDRTYDGLSAIWKSSARQPEM